MREGFSCNYSNVATSETFLSFGRDKMTGTALIMAPFLITLMVSGIASSIAISGFNLTTETLKLNFGMINPVNGFKQLFSKSALVKLLLSVVKIVFISFIVYLYLRDKLDYLVTFQWTWTAELLTVISKLILGVVIRLCMGLVIIGAIDLIYQKKKFIKDLMMSKQEVKEERKDSESPQEVQKRIKQKQFELATRRMLKEVPKANVVIVNPTHVAVALNYDPETMAAPVVVAKGGDKICEKIKEVARAYGVPIIRRPAIARSLYAEVDINGIVPDNLFVAVAEILALVYRLRKRR
jgi:flagellar biosynthesis protein FlhB